MLKRRILFGALVIIAVAALLGSGFSLGWKQGRKFPETVIVQGVGNLEEGKPEAVDFGTFWQAWKAIDETYLSPEDINGQSRLHGAIRGLVGALGDPYSEFFKPDDSLKFFEDIQGSFGGIGAELGARENQIVVVAPLKNTPASRAGLQAGDKILGVNSSSTFGISIDQAVKWIRGPVGQEVALTISREGWDSPREIVIVRDIIVIPTLEVEVVEGNIAHIQLFSFNANANRLFFDEVFKLFAARNTQGLILDLRNNPGGFLEVAVDLAGWFVSRGSLVVTQDGKEGIKQEFRATGNEALKDVPLAIIVNGGSASASEILAGAIKVNRDSVKLVGEKTFGKGTVQELRNLRDGSSLKLTVAHWVLPNGQILEGEGLTPDVEVEMTEEDINAGRDPQLEKAVEILKSEL